MKLFEYFKSLQDIPNIHLVYKYLQDQLLLDINMDQTILNSTYGTIEKFGLEDIIDPETLRQISADGFIWGMIFVLFCSDALIKEIQEENKNEPSILQGN